MSQKIVKASLLNNFFANTFGQVWVVLMSVLFVPVYIKYLGLEAYGIIGFYTFLQSSLVILDLGLRTALGRETVRYSSGGNVDNYRDLLRSIELILLCLAIILVVAIGFSAFWLSEKWFVSETLDPSIISSCLKVMGFVVAFRFLEGIYSSILLGQQKHVLLNALLCFNATLRGLGSVCVLIWISPDLETFFIWQAVVSLLSLGSLMFFAYSTIDSGTRVATFSLIELKRIKSYALSIAGASALGAIVANADKVLLSTLLPLSEFGIYALSATVAAIVLTLASPVNQTWLPKLTQLALARDFTQLTRSFHLGAQISTLLIGSVAIVLIVFADVFLELWTQDESIANRAAPILRLIVIGNFFSSISRFIGQTAYAHGLTKLVLYFNIAAIFIIIPGLILITPYFGAIGAASLWVFYTGGTLLIGCPFFFRQILKGEQWKWYLLDTFIPIGSGLLASLLVYAVLPDPDTSLEKFLLLLLAACLTTISIVLSMPLFCGVLLNRVKRAVNSINFT